ncbi:MAG: hypothetical protein V2A79_15425 [Planctomycetota bacterium]
MSGDRATLETATRADIHMLTTAANSGQVFTFDCYGTLVDSNTGIRAALTRLIDECGAGGRALPDRALAEYQSPYHDGVPCRQLDIPWVWINRLGEENRLDAAPIAEFSDLTQFADALLGPQA